MKLPHLKILLLLLLLPGLCYGGWALLFTHQPPPEKSYVAAEGEASSPAPVTSSVRRVPSPRQCSALAAAAIYSVLLPCVAEHNQPRLHTRGRQTPPQIANRPTRSTP